MESSHKLQGDGATKIKTDDISKAEARAKRKEAKKSSKGKKDVVNQIESIATKNPETDKNKKVKPINNPPAVDNVKENKKNNDLNKVSQEKHINATDDTKSTNNTAGLSKNELKAQRRAIQESQRLAKVSGVSQELPINNGNVKKIPANIQGVVREQQINENTENKSELKAKRRALQETQRLAKTTELKSKTKPQVSSDKNKEPIKLKKVVNFPDSITPVPGNNGHKKLQLFHHLYFQHNPILSKKLSINLHASIIRLGAQYMSHTVLGSNARCLALLAAIKNLVIDYRTPPQQEFCRSLESNIQLSTNYLQMCRPSAVSMTNAIRHIKLHLTQIPENLSDDEKKTLLLDGIDTYIRDEIGMADKAISLTVQGKIYTGDVILIYGCSSIVMKILLDAHNNGQGKSFKVIVVDSRPLLEGREMLRKLVNAGINCSYVLINAVSFIMGKATKVLLGAHSLLANGYVMSRTGTAQIALIAQSCNKPVLVCCETYKFCERVQTDSIVHNEIGDPDKLVNMSSAEEESPLKNWKNSKYVTPLNLMYDVTPPDLVTAVVTELAILPCTSVPVILRIKPTEIAL